MVSLGPKKDGGPNVEFFQSPESMQGFEKIRQWLQKNCKKVSVVRVCALQGGRPFVALLAAATTTTTLSSRMAKRQLTSHIEQKSNGNSSF